MLVQMLEGHPVSLADGVVGVVNLLITIIAAIAVWKLRHRAHERDELLDRVELQREHARSVARIARFALEKEDLSDFFQIVVRKVSNQLKSPCVALIEFGESEGLVRAATITMSERFQLRPDGLLNFLRLTSDLVETHDMAAERRYVAPVELQPCCSLIAVLLPGFSNTSWGALIATDASPRSFSDEDRHYLTSIAQIIGETLQRRESEALYKLMVETGSEMVTKSTIDGKLLWVSPSSERLLGYRPQELLAMTPQELRDLIHPEDQELTNVLSDKSFRSGGEMQLRLRLLPKGASTYRWVDIVYSAIMEEGEIAGVRASARDVTSEVEAEQLKNSLISMTAHELRTPISVMQGYAQLLVREDDLVQAQKMARKIASETQQLAALVGTLLELDPAQLGQQIFRPETTDLCDLVQTEVDRFLDYHPDERNRLVIHRPEGVIVGLWDHIRLGRAILNLIENAAKYSSGEITLECSSDGESAFVRVSDLGIGISRDEINQIFKPYYRSPRSQMSKAQGMGLGLTLAQSSVMMHGGVILVDSTIGRGTTMTVKLPLNPIQGG